MNIYFLLVVLVALVFRRSLGLSVVSSKQRQRSRDVEGDHPQCPPNFNDGRDKLPSLCEGIYCQNKAWCEAGSCACHKGHYGQRCEIDASVPFKGPPEPPHEFPQGARPSEDSAEHVTENKDHGGTKPNIVFILIDDLGYSDIEPFGNVFEEQVPSVGHYKVKQPTPNLNRMAQQGIKLTSFYAAPLCSISRAMFLTARTPPRIKLPFIVCHFADGLNPNEITVADHMKENGYVNKLVGKWHVGGSKEMLPTRQGFHSFWGLTHSPGIKRMTPLVRDEEVIHLLDYEQVCQLQKNYTGKAVAFITMNARAKQPFFLFFSPHHVHTPSAPGKDFRQARHMKNGYFGATVIEMDWSVGEILRALETEGIDNNTLVIFTSDNGSPTSSTWGSGHPFKGGKGDTWEGGMRVPFIARWPGTIPAGTSSDAVTSIMDLLPTFSNLGGGGLLQSKRQPVIDGRDIIKTLKSQPDPEAASRPLYYWSRRGEINNTLAAVRKGQWKLGVMDNNFHPDPIHPLPNPRLYHILDDPGETTDVSSDFPEVVEQLQDLISSYKAEDCGFMGIVAGTGMDVNRLGDINSHPGATWHGGADADYIDVGTRAFLELEENDGSWEDEETMFGPWRDGANYI